MCARNFRVDKINESLKNFVGISHIEKIREEVFPTMAEAKSLMVNLREENETMRRCIRSFDESICQKANKG